MKLHRDIKVTQETSWFILHRIREAWAGGQETMFSGPVEVDETYIGVKRKNMSNARRKALKDTGRGVGGKTAVIGIRDRETNAVTARVIQSTDKPTLQETCSLETHLPPALRVIQPDRHQGAIPSLARDTESTTQILGLLNDVETTHNIILGDARTVRLPSSSVHLVVTSPPYWTLKDYPGTDGQMGHMDDYEAFLDDLGKVWDGCYDALVPGGRLVCVVGDVCLSRRRNKGRHTVVPLHADIQRQCTAIGFDNLAPIIWHKIANMQTEANGKGAYLGKPFEPNGVIKNDIEFILMLRKPGGYRSPSRAARLLSLIPADDHDRWFRQIWSDVAGASTRKHPAPFPLELAKRLVRMFSFVGDTVYDPFTGTATTQLAAQKYARNSIGVEIEPMYYEMAKARLDR